jgi:hypothetical protein
MSTGSSRMSRFLEGGQKHRAARYLLAPPLECLVELWGLDAVQPDQVSGHDDGSPSITLAGPARQSVRLLNVQ